MADSELVVAAERICNVYPSGGQFTIRYAGDLVADVCVEGGEKAGVTTR